MSTLISNEEVLISNGRILRKEKEWTICYCYQDTFLYLTHKCKDKRIGIGIGEINKFAIETICDCCYTKAPIKLTKYMNFLKLINKL